MVLLAFRLRYHSAYPPSSSASMQQDRHTATCRSMVESYHLFLSAIALCLVWKQSTALEQIQNYGQIPGIGDRDRASEGITKLFDYSSAARHCDGSSTGPSMVAKKGDQRLILTIPGFAPIDFDLNNDFSQVYRRPNDVLLPSLLIHPRLIHSFLCNLPD